MNLLKSDICIVLLLLFNFTWFDVNCLNCDREMVSIVVQKVIKHTDFYQKKEEKLKE